MLLDGMITNGIVYEMTVGHQDPSGHSVLWNAIAFERPEASNIIERWVETFIMRWFKWCNGLAH